ncbi:MAG TPA: CPBP family intramembrane glutamic endopeptidase [Gemmatimonadaceae bacterium]|nr:CPBP family intramembrane glutamic endopeptidase [Gemmatimonadaceae bacterium]
MAPGLRAQARDYWATSRSHRHSLLFALPLLLLYELLEVVAPIRASGGVVRNGADVLLTGLFSWMLGPRGPLVFMALVIGGALWLIIRDRSGGPVRVSTLAAMLGESLLLALVFGLVVGTATAQLVGPLRSLTAGGGLDGGPLARLTLSLGAGLYEELLFRVVIVALISNGLRFLGLGRFGAGTIAVIVGALLFSAFHYIGPLGEPLRLESFVFRTLAGLSFSALYLTRGFGISAWTHALYDVAVLL